MGGISNYISYVFLFVLLYFQVFLLVTFFENRERIKLDKERPLPKKLPSVSVIVPCFNEEATISATIKSLLHLNYPRELLKIIVVDDGSVDNTLRVVKKFEKAGVTILHKENGGKHTALNLGLEHTTTDLVGCLDADSFVDKNALREIIKYFDDEKIMAVTPAVRVHQPRTIVQKIQSAEYDLGIFLRKMFGLTNSIYVAPGPFSIFRREVFQKIGGYRHGHRTEDMEMTMRMHANLMPIVNSHTATVTTVGPTTVPKLLRQRFRWVTGFLQNAIDYRRLFFRKKYGVLGLLTLPVAVFSVFTALYFTTVTLINFVQYIARKFSAYHAINFNFSSQSFHIDTFYFNTEGVVIISMALFGILLFMILTGKKLAEGKVRISSDIFYFLIFYGFLAPIWVAKSLYNVILFKEAAWR